MARRETVYVTAREWKARLTLHLSKSAAEQREFDERSRLELSVTDLRDEAVGIAYSVYGRDREGLKLLQANGGACPQTIYNWDRDKVKAPHLNTLRRTLMACGYDFKIGRTNGG